VSGRERRLAENEVRFRDLNERLRDSGAAWEGREGVLGLVCECGNEDCTAAIELNAREYEAVREVETQFLVLRGHERAEIEDVVGGGEGWVIVRKRGEAGEIASETDPRS
jgi:hypothetical protein